MTYPRSLRLTEWTDQVFEPGAAWLPFLPYGNKMPCSQYSSGFIDLAGTLLGHLLWVSSAYFSRGPRTTQSWVPRSAAPGASWLVREGSRDITPGKVMRPQASSALKRSDASTPVCLSKRLFSQWRHPSRRGRVFPSRRELHCLCLPGEHPRSPKALWLFS